MLQKPSRRALQRKPHSALPLFDLAMARPSKRRLDCDVLCNAETAGSFRRCPKEGVIVIKSQQHRSREQNKEEALNRLVELIKSVNSTQKKRIATKPTRGAVRKRLDSKKKHGAKKQLRKKVEKEH